MKEKRINYLQISYYTVAGVVVGILVGAIDAVFGRVLLAITDFRGQHVMVLIDFVFISEIQSESPKRNGVDL